jgi:hypothetical protein
MTRRLAVQLIVLALAVMGGGATSGVLLGRLTTPSAEAAAPASTRPPAPPGGAAPAGTVVAATPLRVSARVVGRSEDGLTLRFVATEPVTATVQWVAGAAVGQTAVQGTGRSGTVKLVFTTTEPVDALVEVRTADGRAASSNPVSGRRLVRRVTLEVTSATLRFSARDRAGLGTAFLGASATPIKPTSAGPVARARPYRFPAVAVTPATVSAALQVRVGHLAPGGLRQAGSARVLVPLPGLGSETLSYSDDLAGVAVSLDLRVTVTLR